MTDNAERDELARIALREIGNECSHTGEVDENMPGGCVDCYKIAENSTAAILAAGYRRPRTITTQEELDALPDGTVIKDPADLLEKEDGRWFYGEDSNVEVTFPVIVLWEPNA